MVHLWEVDHPYYCAERAYNLSDGPLRYRSWAEFIDAEGDADFDMNLVFRWDWREGEGWELKNFNGDVNYRNGELWIYWMGQRRGLFRATVAEVCRADEPAVTEFLKPRLKHLVEMWEPLILPLDTRGTKGETAP